MRGFLVVRTPPDFKSERLMAALLRWSSCRCSRAGSEGGIEWCLHMDTTAAGYSAALQCTIPIPRHYRCLLTCITHTDRTCRVRFEGCAGYSNCSTATIVWEVTFCPTGTMTLCVGPHNQLAGQAGLSTSKAWLQQIVLRPRSRYVFNGFSAQLRHGFNGECA